MTNNVLQEVHRNTQNDTNVQNPLGWCDINHIAPERLPQTLVERTEWYMACSLRS